MQTDPQTNYQAHSRTTPEYPVNLDVSQSSAGISAAVPSLDRLQAWAHAALGQQSDKGFALRIVSVDEMTELNGDYADNHKPTNVLSFPLQEALQDLPGALPDELLGKLDAEVNSLGDIAICADIVAAEAQQQDKTQDAHWAHMITHGVLHLRGYDHVRHEDALAMEAEEVRILAMLGFNDPYQSGVDRPVDDAIARAEST